MGHIASGPRFNEPLYNEVLDITNDILQPGIIYCYKIKYQSPKLLPSILPTHNAKTKYDTRSTVEKGVFRIWAG